MESALPRRETVEQLAEEFVARYRRGERPPLSEYTERYPEHAEQIRDLFPALVMMEQIAPDSQSDTLRLPGRLPPQRPAFWSSIARVNMGSGDFPILNATSISSQTTRALSELPRRLVTQTLPWLSTASPLGL